MGQFDPEAVSLIRQSLADHGITNTRPASRGPVDICRCGHSKQFHSDVPDTEYTWLASPDSANHSGCFCVRSKQDSEAEFGRAVPPPCPCPGFDAVLQVRGFGNHFRRRPPQLVRGRFRSPLPALQASILSIFEDNDARTSAQTSARNTGMKSPLPSPKNLDKALKWLTPCEVCGSITKPLTAFFANRELDIRLGCSDSCCFVGYDPLSDPNWTA